MSLPEASFAYLILRINVDSRYFDLMSHAYQIIQEYCIAGVQSDHQLAWLAYVRAYHKLWLSSAPHYRLARALLLAIVAIVY